MATKTVGTRRTQRLRKVHCTGCGYLIYLSRQWIAQALPECPNPECVCHGQTMECADPADAIECGLMTLDDLPRVLRTEVCRRNGWEDEIVKLNHGRKVLPAKHCAEPGCTRFVKALEKHCAEHQPMPF